MNFLAYEQKILIVTRFDQKLVFFSKTQFSKKIFLNQNFKWLSDLLTFAKKWKIRSNFWDFEFASDRPKLNTTKAASFQRRDSSFRCLRARTGTCPWTASWRSRSTTWKASRPCCRRTRGRRVGSRSRGAAAGSTGEGCRPLPGSSAGRRRRWVGNRPPREDRTWRWPTRTSRSGLGTWKCTSGASWGSPIKNTSWVCSLI